MEHRYFIILYCLNQFNGERSIFAVYHLLKGKKSSQTIQDAKLFNISFLFQTMPDLTRKELVSIINYFQKKSIVEHKHKEIVMITSHGKKTLQEAKKKWIFPSHLEGWEYGTESVIFLKRFHLLTQCVSNLVNDNRSFRPVSNDVEIQKWLKSFLFMWRKTKTELANQIFEECTSILIVLDKIDAEIFTLHLTGSNRIGLTIEQIAEICKREKSDVSYRLQHTSHYFIKALKNDPTSFPCLYNLIKDIDDDIPLTLSTKLTFSLVKKGLSLEQIAKARGIKESTVEDHIVEITLNDQSFSIEAYVDPVLQRKIAEVSEEIGQKRLKPIWEKIQPVTYFQIRLALAKQYNKQ